MLFGAMTIAQETQKKYINYQGVARNADGNLMISESLTIGVKLNFGSSESSFEETHDLTTDANGVFSLLIGNGTAVAGEYNTLPWGSFATFASISINGNEIGTTELMAVPHALSSADNQWHTIGNDIENKNGGNVFVTGSLYASKDLSLAEGAAINEFSTDITLGGNSDEIVPTQKAIKTYVDGQLGGTGGGADDQTAAEVPYDNSTSGLTANTTQSAIDELVGSGAVDADPDPNNEIQDISLLGTELTISDGSTIDLAPIVPPGGTDDQNAAEVPYDNTTSGLTATDAQTAIDELASGGLVDTDDQDLSLSGTTLQITDGTSVDLSTIIPPGGTDDQNASEVPFDNTGTGLSANDTQAAIEELTSGGLVDTDDQDLILAGDVLTIEDGAGSVDLSAYKDEDVTTKTGILLGDGSNVSGLVGTADGQVAKWDAGTSTWKADTDDTGGGGSSLWTENGNDLENSNSGNIGIGTNSTGARLHVQSNSTVEKPHIKIEEDQNDYARLEFTNTTSNSLWHVAGLANNSPANSKLNFFYKNGGSQTDHMTITGDGNVGIGTTNPSTNLHVRGNPKFGNPHIRIEEKGNGHARLEFTNTTSDAFWQINAIGNDGGGGAINSRLNFFFQNDQGNATRMSITGAGNVFVGGSLVHSSDIRLKKDIEELPYGLKEILQFEPKIYRWVDNRNSGTRSLGLIAQKVQQIIPEIVHEEDNAEKTLSLSYTELIPVMISAIKEQHKTIDDQSERISDLEERLKKLEAKIGN